MSFLSVGALDQKKLARQIFKKKVRKNYKSLKKLIKFELSSTTANDVMVDIDSSEFDSYSHAYELALFIVMKKLKRQGYRVELRKGKETSYLFRNDRLYISFYSRRRFL